MEDPVIVLESDKATIEVPSPFAGVVKNVSVQVGDKVSEGTSVLSMEVSETDKSAPDSQPAPVPTPTPTPGPQPAPQSAPQSAPQPVPQPQPSPQPARGGV